MNEPREGTEPTREQYAAALGDFIEDVVIANRRLRKAEAERDQLREENEKLRESLAGWRNLAGGKAWLPR